MTTLSPSAQNLARERRGRGVARRVLIHVEVVVEVGNARPADLGERLHRQRRPVIVLVELAEPLAERAGGQRLVSLHHLVKRQLVLGEHRLHEERAPNLVEVVIDERDPLRAVARPRDQALDEQRFVRRRRDLGEEDRIAAVHVRLRVLRVVRVDRMPHLVCEREEIVESLVVIEQHERARRIRSPRVRAAALAFAFVDIDPTPGDPLIEDGDVLASERREPFAHGPHRFIP